MIELGTHDELMPLGGRYRTMFDLQASRFAETPNGARKECTRCPRMTTCLPRFPRCGAR